MHWFGFSIFISFPIYHFCVYTSYFSPILFAFLTNKGTDCLLFSCIFFCFVLFSTHTYRENEWDREREREHKTESNKLKTNIANLVYSNEQNQDEKWVVVDLTSEYK